MDSSLQAIDAPGDLSQRLLQLAPFGLQIALQILPSRCTIRLIKQFQPFHQGALPLHQNVHLILKSDTVRGLDPVGRKVEDEGKQMRLRAHFYPVA